MVARGGYAGNAPFRPASCCACGCAQKRDALKALLIEKKLLPDENAEAEDDDAVAAADAKTIQEYADDFSRNVFGAESVVVTTREGLGESEDEEDDEAALDKYREKLRAAAAEEHAPAAPVGPSKKNFKKRSHSGKHKGGQGKRRQKHSHE